MVGNRDEYWMFVRFVKNRDPVRIVHALADEWQKSPRRAIRWRIGRDKARDSIPDSELEEFREGRPNIILLLGRGELGRLQFWGDDDAFEWELPMDAVAQGQPGHNAESLARLLGAIGDTGDVEEGFVSFHEVRWSDELQEFTREHGLRDPEIWLPHLNWIDFIPVDRLRDFDGVEGLRESGLTILREGTGGVVVATALAPPTRESVDESTQDVINASTAVWRRRVANNSEIRRPRRALNLSV